MAGRAQSESLCSFQIDEKEFKGLLTRKRYQIKDRNDNNTVAMQRRETTRRTLPITGEYEEYSWRRKAR